MLDAIIIGCGRIAGQYPPGGRPAALNHAQAYSGDARFRLAACVDPDERARCRFAEAWSVPTSCASLSECLSTMQPDVASVCAPTPAHAVALWSLLDSPVRAVLCEKPLTGDTGEARELVAAYQAAGKPLLVNYLRRWDGEMTRLKASLAAGQWGAVRKISGWYVRGILNNGSHMIDLLHFLFGPFTLEYVGTAVDDGVPGDPTIDVLLRSESGISAWLSGGDGRDFNLFELNILTARGMISIEDSGFAVRERRAEPSAGFPGTTGLGAAVVRQTRLADAMSAAIQDLHDAATAGKTPASSGVTALLAQELCGRILSMAKMVTQ